MLRALVLIMLLANLGFIAWREGWLAPLHGVIGARPEGEREPERLGLQVHPDLVTLQATPGSPAAAPASPPPEPAASAASDPAAAPALACLEAGPFDTAGLNAAQAVLQVLLPSDAASVRRITTGLWWVAVGPFAEVGPLRQRRDELRRLDFSPESSRLAPDGAPYLVLQRHDSRDAADAGLKAVAARGVRNVRIVDGSVTAPRLLRVARADADLQALLVALPADKLGGRHFEPCPPDAP